MNQIYLRLASSKRRISSQGLSLLLPCQIYKRKTKVLILRVGKVRYGYSFFTLFMSATCEKNSILIFGGGGVTLWQLSHDRQSLRGASRRNKPLLPADDGQALEAFSPPPRPTSATQHGHFRVRHGSPSAAMSSSVAPLGRG